MKKKILKTGLGIGLIIIAGVGLKIANNNYQENKRIQEKELVSKYVTCLEENFTQRYYCAETLDSNYYYLDSLIKEYGYEYEQVGYDLYVKEAK